MKALPTIALILACIVLVCISLQSPAGAARQPIYRAEVPRPAVEASLDDLSAPAAEERDPVLGDFDRNKERDREGEPSDVGLIDPGVDESATRAYDLRRQVQERIARSEEPERRCPLSLALTMQRAQLDPRRLDDRQINELYDRFRKLERGALEDIAQLQAGQPELGELESRHDAEAQARWESFVQSSDRLAAEYQPR